MLSANCRRSHQDTNLSICEIWGRITDSRNIKQVNRQTARLIRGRHTQACTVETHNRGARMTSENW
jgi:hypothetical protein